MKHNWHNIYGAVFKATATPRAQLVHQMNVEQRQMAADLWNKLF